MFDGFYVASYGVFGNPGIWLQDLGHINGICGRNNSGKTTLLKALTLTVNAMADPTTLKPLAEELGRRNALG